MAEKIKRQSKSSILSQIEVNAAGIDIGAEEHYVAVPADRDQKAVRSYKCFTSDLHEMARWLKSCRIRTIAMESTGVYWIPVFQILEKAGFEVLLVNARDTKNVPGRKTDVLDCQWIQQLHSYGLLRGSFRPSDDICVLRQYMRQRDNLVKSIAAHIQRMQKAMIQMNLQLHRVISDITGKTGIAIIESILQGERHPVTLARLKDHRIKSSQEAIAEALTGDYREEHLFALRQEYELYQIYESKIAECERKIGQTVESFQCKGDMEKEIKAKNNRKRKYSGENPSQLSTQLYRMSGVDFSKVNGMDVTTAQILISECGLDMGKWPSEKHFASWLGLCPNNKITGGKIKSSSTRQVVNRAATALRIAAQSLYHSRSALGAFFRRMKSRLGAPKAITATAHKLACLFYRMLKFGNEYVDVGQDYYETKYRERVLLSLKKSASALGFLLVEKQEVAVGVS
jgi:transposase